MSGGNMRKLLVLAVLGVGLVGWVFSANLAAAAPITAGRLAFQCSGRNETTGQPESDAQLDAAGGLACHAFILGIFSGVKATAWLFREATPEGRKNIDRCLDAIGTEALKAALVLDMELHPANRSEPAVMVGGLVFMKLCTDHLKTLK
jgi:hypothetical protein